MSYITDFVQSLRARGCRDETVKLRRYHVARAIEDLGKPNTWTRREVEAYLANAGWSAATRRSVHASLKAFMRTLDDVEGAGVLEDIKGQWLRVIGKGGHARMVPLPPHLAARVKRRGEGYVFPGQIDGHLSARRVGELIRECLPAGMTPHQLRHRYATTVYRSSGDIRAVQELLGHARLDTTMIYTAVDSDTTASAAAGAWTLTG